MARTSDGSNKAVSASAAILNNYGGAFTIAFWAKLGTNNTTRFLLISADASGTGVQNWRLDHGTTANSIEFVYSNGGGTDPQTGSQAAVPDANWHHYAYRRAATGASEWAYFVDGTKTVISAARDFTTPANQVGFGLWGCHNISGFGLVGSLEDVAIWTVAISDTNILQMARGVWANSLPTSGRVSNWRLMEGGATDTAIDIWSANNLTATTSLASIAGAPHPSGNSRLSMGVGLGL